MKIQYKPIILNLINENSSTTIKEILEKSGNNTNDLAARRAIQRSLAHLIKENVIEAQGHARARIYILKSAIDDEVIHAETYFQTIPLSTNSKNLLRFVTQPQNTRKITHYNQNFLSAYDFHKPYLTSSIQNHLLSIGKVDDVNRASGTYARNIMSRLLIDLSWNSSRLEGNTYSLLETKRLIEFGESVEGKNIAEAQMILNHKEAIEYIVEAASEKEISAHTIRSIHALLSENLLGDPAASGRLRSISVGISGTKYSPLDNPHLIQDYFSLFIKKFNQIKNPFEQSFFSLVHISYLQAFEDVNKRTARLVANIPLIKVNLKPLSFTDVTQTDYITALIGVYEKNDWSLLLDLYIWAYERSAHRYSALQQSIGEPNLLKLKYRETIQKIIHDLIINKIQDYKIVPTIKKQLRQLNLSDTEEKQIFEIIEREIFTLHDGNIARYKITPNEFLKWNQNNK